jgi:Sulfotransferase domain
MPLRVVGAGLGRTGTHSLKLALEQLLGAPCYHMMETFGRPDDLGVWHAAINGDPPDWAEFLSEYAAAVDWPAAAFWHELSDAFPDAVVLLSSRSSADAWWKSANDTIFQVAKRTIPPEHADAMGAQLAMVDDMFTKTFTTHWADAAEAKQAYEQHNAEVRATIAPARLVDWHPGDGWAPICAALSVPVPDDPFPHVNSTSDFRAMAGLDEPST